MTSTVTCTDLASPGRRWRPSPRIMLASLACMFIGVFLAAAPVQEDDTPKGLDVIRTMAMYLTGGTGQWIAPYPSDGDEDLPDAVGLWFELTAQSHVLELTVVFHYGDEVQPHSKSYWFWHPGRREVQYHEVSPGGSIRMGTTHFSDERTFVTLTDAIAADGTTTPSRGDNIILGEDEHVTTAFVLNAAGEWDESMQHTWKRVPESERKSK